METIAPSEGLTHYDCMGLNHSQSKPASSRPGMQPERQPRATSFDSTRRSTHPSIGLAVFLGLAMCYLNHVVLAQPNRPAILRIDDFGPAQACWTGGLLSNRLHILRTATMPHLWSVLDGTNHSYFIENFRIAAGLSTNRPRGAPFNDGEVYKFIEGTAALMAQAPDAKWFARLDTLVDLIERVQRPDGYIHSRIIARAQAGDSNAVPFRDRNDFELYNLGHLFSAACMHYRVTGRTNLLAVAERAAVFLDRMLAGPVPDAAKGSVCPSHFMGLVELWRTTGNAQYLRLAERLFELKFDVRDGDDNQDRLPWPDQTEPVGHAVRANYLYAGAADLFLETGREYYLQPLFPIWSNLLTRKLYITCGCDAPYDSASPAAAKDQKSITRVHQAYGMNYELPNTTAHNETCASIGLALWAWRMFRCTGEAQYMDVLEQALYNTILAGMSQDGTNFFYVNPLRSTGVMPAPLRWDHERQPFLSSFCCPPNLFRFLAQSATFAYAVSSNAIWVNLYGASRLRTTWRGATLHLEQQTEYPWNGVVRIVLHDTPPGPWTLQVRIPGWTRFGTNQVPIRINRAPWLGQAVPGSYAAITRRWAPGDIIDLNLPMDVDLIEAHPLVETTFRQVAVKRGPLVYCLEGVDLPAGAAITDVIVCPMAEYRAWFDRRFLGGAVVIDVPVLLAPYPLDDQRLYRQWQPRPTRMLTARFIPYFLWANRGKSEMSVWFPVQYPAPAQASGRQ